MQMPEKFWEMMEESVLVQASVTLILVVTTCYMFVQGEPVPALLAGTLGTVIGFWFGTKVQKVAHEKAG